MMKLAVIAGAHCSLPWAHQALSQDDGVGHHSGNFGNLLFLRDVIFGTARITRRYPPA